jgi:hypothetical protein
MKYLLGTLAVIVAIAATTCLLAYHFSADTAVKAAVEKRDAMEWLRADFQLSDAQFAKIKQLHDSYSLECEDHCRAIMQATRARNDLKSTSNDASAVAAADRKVEELRRVCETAIAAHVRRCAAEMSPEASQRYLALVLPKIADFDHQAAPDLQLNKQHGHR